MKSLGIALLTEGGDVPVPEGVTHAQWTVRGGGWGAEVVNALLEIPEDADTFQVTVGGPDGYALVEWLGP